MSAIDYAESRAELSRQLVSAFRLVKYSRLDGATVEAALGRHLWIYILQHINTMQAHDPFFVSMDDYDRGTLNFGGAKCFGDDEQTNWTEDEKKLGFAVKLKVPSVIRAQPRSGW